MRRFPGCVLCRWQGWSFSLIVELLVLPHWFTCRWRFSFLGFPHRACSDFTGLCCQHGGNAAFHELCFSVTLIPVSVGILGQPPFPEPYGFSGLSSTQSFLFSDKREQWTELTGETTKEQSYHTSIDLITITALVLILPIILINLSSP